MENESISEDTIENQMFIVKMREKYPKTISRYDEQNNDIDLKLLEKQMLKSDKRVELPKDFVLDDNLLDSLNEELNIKERIILIKSNLKNINEILLQNITMRNCKLYNLCKKC